MIEVAVGDLTSQPVDVIVNAANEYLAHGGGVAAAIVRAGGQVIQDESDQWVREHGPLGAGQAAVTSGGSLPARNVIHVVGPRYREGQDNEGLLTDAVDAALAAAARLGVTSIAFPAISAGTFGYPRAQACRVIVEAIRSWIETNSGLQRIVLVGYDELAAEDFRAALGR
ncbi:MAG: macro domain-containing protein [Actinobacteria bacterium]|nr:macro domain-containing protein [Actinomycetota bacterium]